MNGIMEPFFDRYVRLSLSSTVECSEGNPRECSESSVRFHRISASLLCAHLHTTVISRSRLLSTQLSSVRPLFPICHAEKAHQLTWIPPFKDLVVKTFV